jgi:hypothetical protein
MATKTWLTIAFACAAPFPACEHRFAVEHNAHNHEIAG